ncbi:hypothetical protein MVEN_00330800 [Mycena venus]|uniref:Uncharacterized protein n=1 Tax=Mycena venus TaxID=2733690 RepID=A0A8H7DAG6_9AGAR|nr:hypothetical protein MVEN_00330800 [Mycena venus]
MLSQCSDLLLHLAHKALIPDYATHSTFKNPHLTLNCLESLETNFIGSSIVPHLTLPRLQTLTLSGRLAPAVESFRALLSRSHFSLQTLSLDTENATVKPETFVLFFELFPAVTALRLVVRTSALREFVMALFSPNTLLAMHTLTVSIERMREDYDALLDVLRARRANGTLKSFVLTVDADRDVRAGSIAFPKTAMAQFRDLAQGGLQVRLQLVGNPWPRVFLDTFKE